MTVTATHSSSTGCQSCLEMYLRYIDVIWQPKQMLRLSFCHYFKCHYQSRRKTGPFQNFVTDAHNNI